MAAPLQCRFLQNNDQPFVCHASLKLEHASPIAHRCTSSRCRAAWEGLGNDPQHSQKLSTLSLVPLLFSSAPPRGTMDTLRYCAFETQTKAGAARRSFSCFWEPHRLLIAFIPGGIQCLRQVQSSALCQSTKNMTYHSVMEHGVSWSVRRCAAS